ncbi:MAG: glycosyltransferase family 4 protein [Candidatus Levybacteria bacterium]|nr:glycosyltransferase family 4 protein [Candidatus Levybacteria bacterium]
MRTNLSIALVSSYAFTKEPGGVKDFILGLKSELLRKGYAVNVIAPGSKDAQKDGQVDFVLGKNLKVATDQTEFRIGLSRKKTARKILEKIKPDIVVIHEPFVPVVGHTIISAIPKRADGKPNAIIIGQFHARKEFVSRGLRVLEFIARHIIKRPELRRGFLFSSGYVSTIEKNLRGRIAVSQATRKFWEKESPANYKVICNGIDTKELYPNGPKINDWKRTGRRIIFFAGRHDSRKGIDDLINAISILIKEGFFDIKLKIAGEGEMTAILKRMVIAQKLNDFVDFVGVLPRSELVKAYRTSDLVVAPSTGGEGFNRTIIEARACGALVVCTNIEGQKESIGQDLYSYMARPGNPKNLAKKIKEVLSLSKAKKQEVKKSGRAYVKSNFDWKNIAKQHVQFYKSLIAK